MHQRLLRLACQSLGEPFYVKGRRPGGSRLARCQRAMMSGERWLCELFKDFGQPSMGRPAGAGIDRNRRSERIAGLGQLSLPPLGQA